MFHRATPRIKIKNRPQAAKYDLDYEGKKHFEVVERNGVLLSFCKFHTLWEFKLVYTLRIREFMDSNPG